MQSNPVAFGNLSTARLDLCWRLNYAKERQVLEDPLAVSDGKTNDMGHLAAAHALKLSNRLEVWSEQEAASLMIKEIATRERAAGMAN